MCAFNAVFFLNNSVCVLEMCCNFVKQYFVRCHVFNLLASFLL